MEDRENVFGYVIDSKNDIQNETYERDSDTTTEDVKYMRGGEELISMTLSEKYYEVDVRIDE